VGALIAEKKIVVVTHGTRMLPAPHVIPGLALIWARNVARAPRLPTEHTGILRRPMLAPKRHVPARKLLRGRR
jgi:hypothetical protein